MPVIIGLLVLVSVVYQFFFRYEHWNSQEREGVVYERDNLTGQVRVMQPGEKVDLTARLLGSPATGTPVPEVSPITQAMTQPQKNGNQTDEAFNLVNISVPAHQTSQADNLGIATSPPVPHGIQTPAQYVSRQIDLNKDGLAEEVIQNILAQDGLIDISVVQGGKEIFYGRGKSIQVLPTRRYGWADLALNTDDWKPSYYRYNPKLDGYELVDKIPKGLSR